MTIYRMIDPKRRAKINDSESGAAMVEAAVVLPVFLVVMFISMNASLFCYRLLSFQYEVSDITRQTFVLSASQRTQITGQSSWRNFLETRINTRARELGLLTSSPATSATVQFATGDTPCTGWTCANQVTAGDIFSITVSIQEPIFGSGLARISWLSVTTQAKAIAFIHQLERE